MSIVSEIKKNKAKVFRRLFFRRRISGGDYEPTWQQIDNEYIVKWGKIKNSTDDVKANFYKIDDTDVTVRNTDGYFSEADTNSFFYNAITRYRTFVKIESGYEADDGTEYPTDTTAYIGLIGEKAPAKDDGLLTFKISNLSSVFDKFPVTTISGLGSTQTAGQLIARIRDYQDGNGVYYFRQYVSVGAWTIDTSSSNYYNLATSSSLDGLSAWQLMQKLAESENYVLYMTRTADIHFEPKADVATTVVFHFSGIGDSDRTYGHNVMKKISVDRDINKVYNRVRVKHDAPDTLASYEIKSETWTWGDSSSSFYYGVRTYDYDNEWIPNSVTAATIANAIYTEYVQPKKEITLQSKFVPHLNLNDRISLTYKTKRTEGGSLWGYFSWDVDGVWGTRLGYNINEDDAEYKIVELNHDLNKFYSDVSLREI